MQQYYEAQHHRLTFETEVLKVIITDVGFCQALRASCSPYAGEDRLRDHHWDWMLLHPIPEICILRARRDNVIKDRGSIYKPFMRSLHFLLVIAASFLAGLPLVAAATRTVNAVQNNRYDSRFLRDGGAAAAHTGEDNEERATIRFGDDLVSDKAQTKELLKGLLDHKVPVDKVKKEFLNMPSSMKSFEQLFKHPNWKALDKYEQMVWQKKNEGKTLAYALIGTKYYSKEKTQEELLKWLVQEKSVKTVGDDLRVWGLARNDPIARQNWRAFAMYEKWFAAKDKDKPGEIFEVRHGIPYGKKDEGGALETFKLTGLSASQMAKHEKFPALLMYVKLYLDFKPFRDANSKFAKARRPIS
ncbi:hypothetical protein GQ600_15264 [Phytophthora cactorum]|nr:hypothetical protein GQ600_15264 [Phytophthora cactorum]